MTAAMYEPSRRTPAEELRAARRGAGLEQSELAPLIGVSTKTISRWENGHGEPTISEWRKVASVTNARWLLTGGDELVTYFHDQVTLLESAPRLPFELPPPKLAENTARPVGTVRARRPRSDRVRRAA